MNLKNELIKRLEIRKKALNGEIKLGYELHKAHHLRDVVTVLAYLKKDKNAGKLINNLCEAV